MIESWWKKLTSKFPIVRTEEYVVMPNHFHGIINVGAAPCVAARLLLMNQGNHTGVPLQQTDKDDTSAVSVRGLCYHQILIFFT